MGYDCGKRKKEPESYKSPVEKTAETAHLLHLGIFSRDIILRGMMKRIKSDKALTTAELTSSAGELIHLPGLKGFQIFSRGIHWRMRDIMQAT